MAEVAWKCAKHEASVEVCAIYSSMEDSVVWVGLWTSQKDNIGQNYTTRARMSLIVMMMLIRMQTHVKCLE